MGFIKNILLWFKIESSEIEVEPPKDKKVEDFWGPDDETTEEYGDPLYDFDLTEAVLESDIFLPNVGGGLI